MNDKKLRSNKLLRILPQLLFKKIRWFHRLAVLYSTRTFHRLLNPLWRDTFLNNLIVHSVQLVLLLLTLRRVVKNLLVTFIPIRLCFYFELQVIHWGLWPIWIVQAWIFDAHFFEHAVSTTHILLSLMGSPSDHTCGITTRVILRRSQIHLILLLALIRSLDYMWRLSHDMLSCCSIVSATQL